MYNQHIMYDELYNKLRPLLSSVHLDVHELQAIRFELAEARANALQELHEARPHMLRPKDKDVTDLDRKTQMDGFTAEKEKDYIFLCDLWDIISDYIKMMAADD